METCCNKNSPHPELLDFLFIYKSKALAVFKEVLGLHEISHLSIAAINPQNQILCLSSTPALEFNLFNSTLWAFDNTYNPGWYNQESHATWQSLYHPERYDELYYLKQIKHRYPTGLSLSSTINELRVIYSFASKKECEHTLSLFQNQTEDFKRIGQYCMKKLMPLFTELKG